MQREIIRNELGGQDERSLGALFSELANETSTLVRQEVALAKAEVSEKASRVGKNVGYIAAGGAVAYAGVLAIVAGIIIGLSSFIPAWIAAILVGAVLAVAAYAMIGPALTALRNTELAPRETVETLKEDAQWLKKQVS